MAQSSPPDRCAPEPSPAAWPAHHWPAGSRSVVPAASQAAAVRDRASRRVAFEPMTRADLDTVAELEKTAYTHPWTARHFSDSLQSGYPAVLLLGEPLPGEVDKPVRPDGRVLLGYLVAMSGVDEVHLLNITVAPAHQRQGWARFMLDALVHWSRAQQAQWLWLEVRHSNTPARALYGRYGFTAVGLRRGYYPAGQGAREDALVMSLNLLPPAATVTAAAHPT